MQFSVSIILLSHISIFTRLHLCFTVTFLSSHYEQLCFISVVVTIFLLIVTQTVKVIAQPNPEPKPEVKSLHELCVYILGHTHTNTHTHT